MAFAQESRATSSEDAVDDSPSDGLPTNHRKPNDQIVRYQAGAEEPPSSRASGEAEYTSLSVHSPTISPSLDVLPGVWTRNTHPLGFIDNATDYQSPTTITLPEEEQEQLPSQILSLQSGAGERTLRRTPRNRQIDLRTQATTIKEASTKSQVNGDTQDTAALAASPWGREIHPLKPTASSWSIQQPASSSPEENSGLADRPHLRQLRDERQNSTENDWYDGIDLQEPKSSSLTASTASSPLLQSDPESVNTKVTRQPHTTSDTARESKSWHRQRYPLQTPVSRTNLQDRETPPSSYSETENQNETLASRPQTNRDSAKKSKKWHRPAYPLQAPASTSNLKHHVTPLSLHTETENLNETVARRSQNASESKERDSWHRRTYPLQAPASNSRPKHHVTSPSSHIEIENVSETVPHQPQNVSESESKSWNRKAYPLQMPASRATLLEQWLTPPPSPERGPENDRMISAEQIRDDHQAAPRDAAFRRQMYPLQPPASIKDSRLSSYSSPSVERGVQEQVEPTAEPSRKRALAAAVINQWHRQTYPLQSPYGSSPFYRSQTPQPQEEEAKEEHIRRPLHLPKNMSAVKDAEKHESKGRTIVVCLDGTGDKFDNDNSNIVHLISALKKDDARQTTYYQAGVGTYGASGISGGVTAAMDMAVGSSLGLHVRDAYHFLMHTYKEGDRICIFGFSRGAYTARCLAGMIHKVGLLPPRNIQQISFAYQFYADDTPAGWKQSHDFKKTFCIDICVYFLGCFDSVASVGFIPRQLPLSSTPTNKAWYFRHAMALDERRAKFKICRHQTKDFDDIKAQDDAPSCNASQMKHGKSNHPNLTDEEHERLEGKDDPFQTDVLEVWFAGAHADIGGGAVPNDERHKLAQIPLRWMIRQAFECNTGIIFKTAVLAEHGLDVHMLWPRYKSLSAPTQKPPPSFLEKYKQALPPRSVRRSKLIPTDRYEKGEQFLHLKSHTDEDWTPEQVEDFYDALSPLNDQLVQAPSWWILELLPVEYVVPIALGKVTTRVGMNLGRYRALGQNEPNVHWTALHRAQHNGYKIQARVAPNTIWRTAV